VDDSTKKVKDFKDEVEDLEAELNALGQ